MAQEAPPGESASPWSGGPLTAGELATAERIRPHLSAGCLVVVGDGAGAPVGLGRALTAAARDAGGVRLLLGWSLALSVELDPAAFPDVRVVLGGYALRREMNDRVQYLPVRLSALPSLLAHLRPDLAVVSVRPGPGGLAFGSEVSWMAAAVDASRHTVAELNHGLPRSARTPVLRRDQVEVVSESDRPPLLLPSTAPGPEDEMIGRHVAALVREGDSLQMGPGRMGDAVLGAVDVPVRIDSGIVTDAVVDLEARGLLLDEPRAAYLVGTERLFEWADGRAIVDRVEHTHDLTRLAATPLVAVNTALELDRVGSVNVEGVGGRVIAGIGGHGDFATAASRALRGTSVVALPTTRGGRPTLVDRLSSPVSTGRSDVDVVVTETGFADLRGLSDRERERSLSALWDS
jgi:acyl-CoA hydrolase